jgi:hypothetical protein
MSSSICLPNVTRSLLAACLLTLHLLVPSHARAQDSTLYLVADASVITTPVEDTGPYFYQGLPYGSEAYYGPFAVILNKGFAVSLMEGVSRKLSDFPYGVASVADALAHPVAAIERQGSWWKFVREEMVPLSWSPDRVKWLTNYTGHLVEGGILWRQLKEWYESRGVPLAGVMSGITTMSAAFLNEVYESQGATRGSAATVADLYFFDIAGIVLFSFDGVSRFFSRKLHANVWTGQASIVLPAGETDNNASHVYFKIPWGLIPSSSLFIWNGIGFGLGLSLHRSRGLDISFGVGPDAQGRTVNPVTGVETATVTWGAGIFVDRNGSLLASAHVSQVQHRLLRLNVYPGVLGGLGRDFGAWMIVSHDFEVRFGISSRYWLGVGLGLGR